MKIVWLQPIITGILYPDGVTPLIIRKLAYRTGGQNLVNATIVETYFEVQDEAGNKLSNGTINVPTPFAGIVWVDFEAALLLAMGPSFIEGLPPVMPEPEPEY